MVNKKSWEWFRSTGLLWFVNMILHTFGWAIVLEPDGEDWRAYPARVKYRGFSEDNNTKGYQNISQFMVEKCP